MRPSRKRGAEGAGRSCSRHSRSRPRPSTPSAASRFCAPSTTSRAAIRISFSGSVCRRDGARAYRGGWRVGVKASRVLIERLTEASPALFDAMVAESEGARSRFVRRLADEWASGTNRFDRPGEVLFVAWADGRLIGACGLNVDPYTQAPGVGRVRHLYVLTDYRRSGVGRRLVE